MPIPEAPKQLQTLIETKLQVADLERAGSKTRAMQRGSVI